METCSVQKIFLFFITDQPSSLPGRRRHFTRSKCQQLTGTGTDTRQFVQTLVPQKTSMKGHLPSYSQKETDIKIFFNTTVNNPESVRPSVV